MIEDKATVNPSEGWFESPSVLSGERAGSLLSSDSEAGPVEVIHGLHPGDDYLRITRRRDFRRVASGYLVPRGNVGQRKQGIGAAVAKAWRLLVGRRLATSEEPHERVSVFTGLSVF